MPFRRQTSSLQLRPAWVFQRAERGQYFGEVLRGSCRRMKLSRRAGESWPIDAHRRDLGGGGGAGVLWISQARKISQEPAATDQQGQRPPVPCRLGAPRQRCGDSCVCCTAAHWTIEQPPVRPLRSLPAPMSRTVPSRQAPDAVARGCETCDINKRLPPKTECCTN